MKEALKDCPFCGGKGEETQTGENYVIVRCESNHCAVKPSAVCYRKQQSKEYDFWPWNNRAPAQSLASIKAQAVTDLISEYACSATVEGIATSVIYVDGAISYAAKIGGGE